MVTSKLTFTIRMTTDGDNTPIQSLIVIVDGVGYQIPKTEIGDSSDFMVSGPKHNVLGGRSSFEVSCNMNVRE